MRISNLRRYLYGILIGMIGEYLFRVGFNIIPFVILSLLLVVAVIDIIYFSTKQN